jgi:hypothetical protein
LYYPVVFVVLTSAGYTLAEDDGRSYVAVTPNPNPNPNLTTTTTTPHTRKHAHTHTYARAHTHRPGGTRARYCIYPSRVARARRSKGADPKCMLLLRRARQVRRGHHSVPTDLVHFHGVLGSGVARVMFYSNDSDLLHDHYCARCRGRE